MKMGEIISQDVSERLKRSLGHYTDLTSITTQLSKKADKVNMKYFAPQLFSSPVFSDTGIFDWNSTIVRQKMDYYKTLKMNSILLLPYAAIETNGTYTKRYSNLDLAIQYAHSIGLKVIIRPHIKNRNQSGSVYTVNESILALYETCVSEIATIAKNNKVEGFIFGVECSDAFGLYNDTRARQSIQKFKEAYGGVGFFTYGGTRLEVDKITWWDMCDYVGIDFYNTATMNIYATPTEIYQGFYSRSATIFGSNTWASTPVTGYDYLKTMNTRWNKPIFIVEWYIDYGTNSIGGTNFQDKLTTYTDINLEQKQADGMDASLRFFNDLDFVIGNSIWCDLADNAITDNSWDDGKFTSRVKSENIVKKWGAYFG
jgi:hypothetical protein